MKRLFNHGFAIAAGGRAAPCVVCLFVILSAMVSAARAMAAPQDPESAPLNAATLLEYKGLLPFVSFQYPVEAKMSGDDMYVEQQYMGYLATIQPGATDPGQAYFEASILLVKSYDSAVDVMDQYLREMDLYMEPEFAHHTITTSIRADGARFSSFAGRGYVAHGVVVADGPLQGMSFSEEFRNFVLPGNVDLRVIFKYPTAMQNNEQMRSVLETLLSSLVVHSDYFQLTTDTRIDTLRFRDRK